MHTIFIESYTFNSIKEIGPKIYDKLFQTKTEIWIKWLEIQLNGCKNINQLGKVSEYTKLVSRQWDTKQWGHNILNWFGFLVISSRYMVELFQINALITTQ